MRRLNVQVSIDESTIREIENTYGKSDYLAVSGIVNDILSRYLNVQYFDPNCSTEEDNYYVLCEHCGEKSKRNKVIDVDGINLEEHCVCENCGYGQPRLY